MRTSWKILSNSGVIAILVSSIAGASAQTVFRETAQIVAGPTVQVSSAFPDRYHYENEAAGDPVHPGHVISCSMADRSEFLKFIDQYCYATFDGGKTWKPTLKLDDYGDEDPALAFGLGNDVYVSSLVMYRVDRVEPADPNAPPHHDNCIGVYKSTDGGRTWKRTACWGDIDRETIVVDTSRSRYRGTVYLAGQGTINDINGAAGPWALALWHSVDGGKTFLGPVQATYPPNTIIFGVGDSAVLSDGTYVVMFGLTKPGQTQAINLTKTPNAELRVITSRDGGQTFDASQKIADVILDRPRSEGGILNELAADPGSKFFKDRLYAVYPEIVDNRIQVGFSYSADKGKTWSKPIIVNDDRSPIEGGHGPDHILPAVAVNKDGVVLVSWYDRRNASDNLGWRLRAAASLDGGQTFSASVPITPYADSYGPSIPWDVDGYGFHDPKRSLVSIGFALDSFFVAAGHTTGMAADASGAFYPTWIDDHTGIAQLWSAAVRVHGTVTKNGAPELATLDDVSKQVTLECSRPVFDRATGTLTMFAQLKNVSHRTIRGPFKLRVLTLESGLGVPEITNADNHEDGTGAIWEFTAQVPGGKLASLELSKPKLLTFRLLGLRPIRQGRDFSPGIFDLDGRIFASNSTEKAAQ